MVTTSLADFVEKKSFRAESLSDFESMVVLGVSNKLGITVTDHKKSKDLAKYLLIEEGDFAYNPYRINVGSIGLVPKGIRGLVSPAYVVFSTTYKLIPELLLDFLKSQEGLRQVSKYARGTVRKALRFEDLCQIELPIPTIEVQREILEKRKGIETEINELKSELTHQQTLLKKLRQQILQEAIEGKLTADWRAQNPDVEPASELLKRIAAEKGQLVKAKRIKAQKPLQPICDEDKPFALPQGWQWCRFGDYALFERGRFSIRPRNDPSCFGGKYPFIQIGSLDEAGSVVNEYKQTLNEKGFSASKMFEEGTVVIAIVGGTIGNIGVLGRDICFPDSMVGVRPAPSKNQGFILTLLRHYQPIIRKAAYQMAGQPNIKLPTLNNLVCALPPIEEQNAILLKIEKLLTLCDQLETQISQNQTHAEQLMQAVLKEAFSHNSASKPAATNPQEVARA